MKEGFKGLVAREELITPTANDVIYSLYFPLEVTLETEVTDNEYFNIEIEKLYSDGYMIPYVQGQLQRDMIYFQIELSDDMASNPSISYESDDGIHYVRRGTEDNALVVFPEPMRIVHSSETHARVKEFLNVKASSLDGIYATKGHPLGTSLLTIDEDILELPYDLNEFSNWSSQSRGAQLYVFNKNTGAGRMFSNYSGFYIDTTNRRIYALCKSGSYSYVYKYNVDSSKKQITSNGSGIKIGSGGSSVPYSLGTYTADEVLVPINIKVYDTNAYYTDTSTYTQYTRAETKHPKKYLTWEPQDLGLLINPFKVIPGNKVLTSRGMQTGKFGSALYTEADLYELDSLINKIRSINIDNFYRFKYEIFKLPGKNPLLDILTFKGIDDFANFMSGMPDVTEVNLKNVDPSASYLSLYDLYPLLCDNPNLETIYNADRLDVIDQAGTGIHYVIGWFKNNPKLKHVYGSEKLVVSKGGIFTSWFSGCSEIEEIDLSNLVSTGCTGNSTSSGHYHHMFYNCVKLKKLLLPKFDFSISNDNRNSYENLLGNCNSLMHLDIRSSSFDTGQTTTGMFAGIPANCLIIVKDTTAKNFILGVRSDFTNIKTLAEYKAEGGV